MLAHCHRYRSQLLVGGAIEMHMTLRHPGVVLGRSCHAERGIVVPDGRGGLQPRTGVGIQLPRLTAGIEATAERDQCVVGDSSRERDGGGLESGNTHCPSHFLEGGRVVQVREPQVGNKIACSTATACASWQNHRVDGFRFDPRVFDGAHRRFQGEFESALGRAACVGRFANSHDARAVPQISQLRHSHCLLQNRDSDDSIP